MTYIHVKKGDLITDRYGEFLIVVATYEDWEGRENSPANAICLLGKHWVMAHHLTQNYRIQINLSNIAKVYKGNKWDKKLTK